MVSSPSQAAHYKASTGVVLSEFHSGTLSQTFADSGVPVHCYHVKERPTRKNAVQFDLKNLHRVNWSSDAAVVTQATTWAELIWQDSFNSESVKILHILNICF